MKERKKTNNENADEKSQLIKEKKEKNTRIYII